MLWNVIAPQTFTHTHTQMLDVYMQGICNVCTTYSSYTSRISDMLLAHRIFGILWIYTRKYWEHARKYVNKCWTYVKIRSTYIIHSFSKRTLFRRLWSNVLELMRNKAMYLWETKLCTSNLRRMYVQHMYSISQHISATFSYAESFEHAQFFLLGGQRFEHRLKTYHSVSVQYMMWRMPSVPKMCASVQRCIGITSHTLAYA